MLGWLAATTVPMMSGVEAGVPATSVVVGLARALVHVAAGAAGAGVVGAGSQQASKSIRTTDEETHPFICTLPKSPRSGLVASTYETWLSTIHSIPYDSAVTKLVTDVVIVGRKMAFPVAVL